MNVSRKWHLSIDTHKLIQYVLNSVSQVGGIKPGCFKIGNTGGMLDNILASKLYRPGSVAYVSRSGGMSNELNNIVSRTTDGVYEGVAIGGDRCNNWFPNELIFAQEWETIGPLKLVVKILDLRVFNQMIQMSEICKEFLCSHVVFLSVQISRLHLHGPRPSLPGHSRG